MRLCDRRPKLLTLQNILFSLSTSKAPVLDKSPFGSHALKGNIKWGYKDREVRTDEQNKLKIREEDENMGSTLTGHRQRATWYTKGT